MTSSMPCRLSLLLRKQEGEDVRENPTSSQSVSSTSSKSIPIHFSPEDVYEKWEIQEQEMIAEQRDFIMFHRIINGMMRITRTRQSASRSSSSTSSASYRSETDKSIASVMRTRYEKINSIHKRDSDSVVYDDDDDEEADALSDANLRNDDRPPDAIFIIDL